MTGDIVSVILALILEVKKISATPIKQDLDTCNGHFSNFRRIPLFFLY